MDEWVTQVGVGGIFVIVVLQSVLSYLKNGKGRNGQFIDRTEFERHKENVRYRDTCEQIHKAIEKQFLSFKEDFKEIKDLIRNNGHD